MYPSHRTLIWAASAAVLLTLPAEAQVRSQSSKSPVGSRQIGEPKPIGIVERTTREPAQEQDSTADLNRYLRVVGITIGTGKEGTSNVPVGIQLLRGDPSRTVTAFAVDMIVTYAGGSQQRTHMLADLLENVVVGGLPTDNMMPYGHKPIFDDSGVHQTSSWVYVGPDRLPPVAVTGTVSALVFLDRTAIGDPQRIAAILGIRKTSAQYYEDLLQRVTTVEESQVVKKAFADSSPNATELLRRHIQEQARVLLADPNSFRAGNDLKVLSIILENFGGKRRFEEHIGYYRLLHDTIVEQSTLKESK